MNDRIKDLSFRSVVRILFGLLAVALAFLVLARNWDEAVQAWEQIGAAAALLSLLLGAIGVLLSMVAWWVIISDRDRKVPFLGGARVYFLGQLGKYIPGSVWNFVAQSELGRDYGIPARRTLPALLMSMLLMLAAALLVAFVALLSQGSALGQYAWAFFALPLLLLGLHPAIVNRVVGFGLRVLGKGDYVPEFTGKALLQSAALSIALWVFFGLQGAVLAFAIAGSSWSLLVTSVGGMALAWAVGFLVVPVPAGAGIREAVLVVVLTPSLSPVDALVVALMARLGTVVADIGWAGLGSALGRQRG